MYCIYRTTNLLNGHYYLGKTSEKYIQKGYYGSGTLINRSVEKYGRENFITEILERCKTEEEAYEAEARYVTEETLKDPNCYNLKLGGRGSSSGTVYMHHRDTNIQVRVHPCKIPELLKKGYVVGRKAPRPEAIKKSIQTRIQKYGGATACMITPEAIAKAMRTRAEKHGGDPMAQLRTPEVIKKARERGKEVLAAKYGGDVMGQCHTPEARQRIRSTMAVKYGSTTGRLLDPESKHRSKATRASRYGYAEACMNTPEANRKSLETRMVLYEKKRKVIHSEQFSQWYKYVRKNYHNPKDAVKDFLQENHKTLDEFLSYL